MKLHEIPPTEAPKKQGKPGKKPISRPMLILRILFHLMVACFTLALVAGAVLLVAYRDTLNMDALRRYLTYSQLSSEEGELASFIHAGGTQMDFCRLDSGVVLASHAGGHYYSISGESYAEAVDAFDAPVLSHSNTTAVVYDAGGQSLYLFADRTLPFSLSLNDGEELLSARPNDAGWLAVTAQLTGYKGTVSLYDASHKLAMEINLSSSFIMDGALSPDCSTVAVVTIGQTDGVFQSNLLLYPVGGSEPSSTLSLGDCIVLDMNYESDCIWIVGDRALLTVEGSTVHSYSYGQYHLKGYSLDGDGFAALLLSEYATGDPNLLVTLDEKGAVLGTQSLLGAVPDLDADGDYLSLLSGEGLTVYTPTLTQYAQLDDSLGTQALAQYADGSVLLADAQEAWIFIPD